MGLFSKKPDIYKELSFNRAKLEEAISKISKAFYPCQKEHGLLSLMEVIRLERNIAMITIHTAKDETHLREQQARIRAFSDLLVHVERCVADGKHAKEIEDKKTSPGAIKQPKRSRGKKAGLSI
jgi:hypothetical protein